SKRSWVRAATVSAAGPGTSIGYSFLSTYEQVGWGTTTTAPASTAGRSVSRFFSALRAAAGTSPPSRQGLPQHTWAGHDSAQPFRSRTETASFPTWGSL